SGSTKPAPGHRARTKAARYRYLIAEHQREIRELQGPKHRVKTRGFASIKTAIGWATMGFALRTVAGWSAMGFAAWFLATMIWGSQRTQEIQILRGGS